MERTALLQADYLDILFDRRNKNYGGYELRKHYPQRVKKAVLGVLITTGVICAYTVFANNTKPGGVTLKDHGPTILNPPPEFEHPKEKPHIQPPSPPQPPVASKAFIPPVIAPDKDVKPEEALVANDELKNKMISNTTHDGDSTNTDISVPPDTHPGTGGNGPIESDPPPSKPVTFVDQMPEFNGDINKYLAGNTHYPPAAKDAGIEGRVVVQFVVNTDGSIVDAHVVRSVGGGCNEEALRVVNSMPRWKPGKSNGTPVRVLFTLPMTFRLE